MKKTLLLFPILFLIYWSCEEQDNTPPTVSISSPDNLQLTLVSDNQVQLTWTDINNMVDYWSRKYIYANNELVDNKCREPWGTEIDCEDFEQKYYKNIYLIPDRDEVKKEPPAPIKPKDKVVIKDNNGVDVEIDIKEFTKHINEFHHIVTSIHQERGHYFTVNKRFRKMLNGKIEQ